MSKRAVALFVCFAALAAHADRITLKNGDTITGTVSSSDAKTLSIKTDYAGTLNVKWAEVRAIASDQPLYVTSKNGEVLVGAVSTEDGRLRVASKGSGAVEIPRDDVAAIRSESAQHAYGAWGGFLDSGLSLARGNADTTTFSLGASAARTTDQDRTSAFVNSLLSKSRTGGIDATTASAIHGGLRYDFNIGQRGFAFAFTDFDHDRFQALDLRNVLGGGGGYRLAKSEATLFDVYAGASLDQEFFTVLSRRSGELLLGEHWDHKLSDALSFKERFEFYPNLTDAGQYRTALDAAAVAKVTRLLSWQVQLSDRYLSNPVLDLKGNDLLLTTGVRVTFGAPAEH